MAPDPSRRLLRNSPSRILSVVLLGAAALGLAPSGRPVRAAIDPSAFDRSVRPQDDFYGYVNGGWIRTHEIPPAYTGWGTWYELEESNEKDLHAILDRAARAGVSDPVERRVGDFYASGLNETLVNAVGIAPIQGEFDRIAALGSPAGLPALLAHLQHEGVDAGFAVGSEQDCKDSDHMIAGVGQGGLGLPDRDYYFRDDDASKAMRVHYEAHVARMLVLTGMAPAQAAAGAAAVLELETDLARVSRPAADLRDPNRNYHKVALAKVRLLTPHFNWNAYFAGLGIAAPPVVDVGQPEFIQGFDGLIQGVPLQTWRTYLRWHLVHTCAPYLSKPFVDENFVFFRRELMGMQAQRERWKRVLATVDASIGEDLGRLYVAEYFPPESKARILALVGNLREALRARITSLEWMDQATRDKALAKLDALGVKVGYPDKWIDYARLSVDRGPYILNVLRANDFNEARDLAKIGRPMDRLEWGMTPPTVNAYYDPTMNEIVFPAGMLQPPFFDAKADDPINYGAIGAIIGHEMTHGFDDTGRQFDPKGNLTDWWTKQSAERFRQRAQRIIRQFNGYVAIGDLHINGQLTQGENIADLGGVKIAYLALQRDLAGAPRTPVGGFTPEQRFFLSFGTIWRSKQRDQALRLQVNTDPHSPDRFRVNGPLSNLDEFAAAFSVPEGAPMRRPASTRVNIW